jgi:hypothetical protein
MNGRQGSQGGGAILALSICIGAVLGVIAGEPTIGTLAGTGAGVVVALAIWWRDRRR